MEALHNIGRTPKYHMLHFIARSADQPLVVSGGLPPTFCSGRVVRGGGGGQVSAVARSRQRPTLPRHLNPTNQPLCPTKLVNLPAVLYFIVLTGLRILAVS